jgi:hypothetical protein
MGKIEKLLAQKEILENIKKFDKPIEIFKSCEKIKSPRTFYKYLKQLEEEKFIKREDGSIKLRDGAIPLFELLYLNPKIKLVGIKLKNKEIRDEILNKAVAKLYSEIKNLFDILNIPYDSYLKIIKKEDGKFHVSFKP